jgi:hypothetical protein
VINSLFGVQPLSEVVADLKLNSDNAIFFIAFDLLTSLHALLHSGGTAVRSLALELGLGVHGDDGDTVGHEAVDRVTDLLLPLINSILADLCLFESDVDALLVIDGNSTNHAKHNTTEARLLPPHKVVNLLRAFINTDDTDDQRTSELLSNLASSLPLLSLKSPLPMLLAVSLASALSQSQSGTVRVFDAAAQSGDKSVLPAAAAAVVAGGPKGDVPVVAAAADASAADATAATAATTATTTATAAAAAGGPTPMQEDVALATSRRFNGAAVVPAAAAASHRRSADNGPTPTFHAAGLVSLLRHIDETSTAIECARTTRTRPS